MSSALLATESRADRVPARSAARPAGRRCGTITVRPAPEREPPFDDEVVVALAALPSWTGWPASAGPSDQWLPFERGRRRRPVRPAGDRSGERAALPEPAPWGQRLLVGIIETAGGRRPLQQLDRSLSPAVLRGLRGDFDRAVRTGRRHWTHAATVRSVRASEPAPGVAELSATLRTAGRVRAVAMRLEAHDGRWRCTLLQLG
jgi:hypothetical protein